MLCKQSCHIGKWSEELSAFKEIYDHVEHISYAKLISTQYGLDESYLQQRMLIDVHRL